MWVDKTCEVSSIICLMLSRGPADINELVETRQVVLGDYGLQPVSEYNGWT
jgi:hypothetical protein